MNTKDALFICAAQAYRHSPPSDGRPFLVWREYAAVNAVCAFLRWGAV